MKGKNKTKKRPVKGLVRSRQKQVKSGSSNAGNHRDITELRKTEKDLAHELKVNMEIAKLAKMLISESSIEEISILVLEQAKRLTKSKFGYVGYIDPKNGYLICPTLTRDIWNMCRVKDKDIVFKKWSGLWGWVLDNRKPILTNKLTEDHRSCGTPSGHIPIYNFLSVPSLIGKTLFGQVALANSSREYTKKDQSIIMQLGNLYAVALYRKRTEEILRKSEEKYRSLITNIPDVIWSTDINGATNFISANVEKVYGYTPEEIYSAGEALWFGRIHPDDVEKVKKEFKALFEEGKTLDVDYRIQRKDGKWIWLQDKSISIYEKDGISYADGVFIDITERKKAEESLKNSKEILNQQKTDLEKKNIVLGEMLSHFELEKSKLQENIDSNIEELLFPIIRKFEESQDNSNLLGLLRKNLEALTSSFGNKISKRRYKLTPKEIEICNMIKNGFTSKDISDELNLSLRTIETHRRNIRYKLDISNKEINLISFLQDF